MSHFVVGVIAPKDSDYDTLENMLAPYDENAEYDFKDCSEEIRERYLNRTVTMYRTEDDDLIVIKLIDGSQRVIPLNNQVYRTERYYNGTIIVIRFYRYIHVGETKRNPRRSCPLCPNCDIA